MTSPVTATNALSLAPTLTLKTVTKVCGRFFNPTTATASSNTVCSELDVILGEQLDSKPFETERHKGGQTEKQKDRKRQKDRKTE
jgi:hypothetical protein